MTPLLASANNVWDVAILLVGLPARVDARAPIGGIHPHHGCLELKHGSLKVKPASLKLKHGSL